MEDILKTVGMDFANVVRTWMYLRDLLTWYDDVNKVRNTFFEEKVSSAVWCRQVQV